MSDLFGGLVLLSAGTLYPAYSSYKAVKNKNTREYVKWMMYWIVFAFFMSITMFTDMFLSWFPGYYFFKTLFILWLVSPATRGSTYLYKKVVHPTLRKNEEKIDRSIENIKERGYDYTSQWARVAMQNFSRALMEAVFRGQVLIADQMQRQYVQQNANAAQFPSSIVTDGREVEHLSRSTSEGRLYRVDSQMFDMDDEFIDLSADVAGESKPKLRQRKPRGMRPVSMPVPTIDENEAYSDEAVHSDPDYKPDEARSQGRRSKSKQDQGLNSAKRVTRTSSKRMDTIPDISTDTPASSEDLLPDSPMN